MQNYIINATTNEFTLSKEYHFYRMDADDLSVPGSTPVPLISLTISPTKQMKKFIKRLKNNYERNAKDNHFIFQDNLYLKSFTNENDELYLKIKNLYGSAKLDVNIAVNYELLDCFVPEE